MRFLDLDVRGNQWIELALTDRLALEDVTKTRSTAAEALDTGLPLQEIPPLTPLYLEFGLNLGA
jgi:hypothetical protein